MEIMEIIEFIDFTGYMLAIGVILGAYFALRKLNNNKNK